MVQRRRRVCKVLKVRVGDSFWVLRTWENGALMLRIGRIRMTGTWRAVGVVEKEFAAANDWV